MPTKFIRPNFRKIVFSVISSQTKRRYFGMINADQGGPNVNGTDLTHLNL